MDNQNKALKIPVYYLNQLPFVGNTRLVPYRLSIPEQDQCWYTPDAETRSDRLIPVHINLNDTDPAVHLGGYFLQDGRLNLAWRAPICIKIDEHRFIAIDECIKISFHCYTFCR